MSNESLTSFYLSEFQGMEGLQPLFFSVFLLLYVSIVVESVALIAVICSERRLHRPMYLLLGNLAANGLCGSTALLPSLLVNLLSRSHEVSVALCQTQVYAIHTYASVEYSILAAMSYDRYVAICHPLTYGATMSQRLVKLLVGAWLCPLLTILLVLLLTASLSYCGRTIRKLYCVNYLLVALSCSDTAALNALSLLIVAVYGAPLLFMIFFSYIHILRVCIRSSRSSRVKALRTCTPHLLAVANFFFGCLFEIAQGRLDSGYMSYHGRLFMSLYFLIFPPLLNPVIYGLSIQVVRLRLLRCFHRKSRQLDRK